MSVFDNLTKKVSDLSNSVMDKTKTSAENIRLNGSISTEEKMIASDYQEIGKRYRQMFGENPAPEFADLLADIVKREAIIADYRLKVQQNRGKVACAGCGAEISITAAFCPSCGFKNTYQPPVADPVQNAPLEKTCTGCGATIPAESLFCTNCGSRQDTVVTAADAVTPSAIPNEVPTDTTDTTDTPDAE